MKKRATLIRLAVIPVFLCLAVGFCSFFENKNEIIPLSVSFSTKNFPVIKATIEGKEYPFYLSLAHTHPLSISEKILKTMQKSQKGETSVKTIQGEEMQTPLFVLPRVDLGGLKLTKVPTIIEALEEIQETAGNIAWPLNEMSVLLDLPHNKIFGVKNKKNLSELGIDLKKMEKVKYNLHKKIVHLHSTTSLGKLTMILDTAANLNGINQSILKQKNICSKLKIGNKEFGEKNFCSMEISPQLGFDGILGAAFLKKHIVYIDARSKYLYIGEKFANHLPKQSVCKIPVDFTFSALPVIEVKIQDENYKFMVDLGSDSELDILQSHFQIENLDLIKTSTIINASGEGHEVHEYALSECQIGEYTLKNFCLGVEETSKTVTLEMRGEKEGTLPRSQVPGTIGAPLLHRTNIYFDFPHSCMLFAEKKEMKNMGIELEGYEKVPFTCEKNKIVLNIKTDSHDLSMLLDTGCSVCLIQPKLLQNIELSKDAFDNSCVISHKFILGNSDYGEMTFYPFAHSPKFGDYDGILGMNFLRHHEFYIDFQNRYIYFKKP